MALALFALACIPAAAQTRVFRSIDGSGNNPFNANWGASGQPMVRSTPHFTRDLATNASATLPNPRYISQRFNNVSGSPINPKAPEGLPAWGQFITHAIMNSRASSNPPTVVHVPAGDPYFDPDNTGNASFNIGSVASVIDSAGAPLPISDLSAFVDGDPVYGASSARVALVRSGVDGKLRTLPGNPLFPPLDDTGVMMPSPTAPGLRFLTGDPRANIVASLTAYHIVFFREHNRKCDELKAANPALTDTDLFFRARAHVEALIQHITYDEYMPRVLGYQFSDYPGYDPLTQPGVDVLFGTVAFRYGHTATPSFVARLNPDGTMFSKGPLILRDHYWNQNPILEDGIEPILMGLRASTDMMVDPFFVDDLRNFFNFGSRNLPLDLMAITIFRARQRGLPNYNQCRVLFNLPPATTFANISSHVAVQDALNEIYNGDVDAVEAYVGGLSEDPLPEGLVGPLFAAIIERQFELLRISDRFWYENGLSLTPQEIAEVKATTLNDVIVRNSELKNLTGSAFSLLTFNQAPTPPVGNVFSLGDKCTLKFVISSNEIEFTYRCQTTGWLGIGFGKSDMKNCDITYGFVSASGAVTIIDAYASGFKKPTPDTDHSNTGSSDITIISGSQSGSYTELTWKRALTTKDQLDYQFDDLSQDVPVIYAWGGPDEIEYHAENRGSAVVNFNTNSVAVNSDTFARRSVKIFHAVVMLLAFGLAYPITAFVARYSHAFSDWLSIHRTVASFSALSMVLLALAAITSSSRLTTHGKLGIAITCLIVFQLAMGYSATVFGYFYHRETVEMLRNLRSAHILVGYAIIISGTVNVFLGIGRLWPHYPQIQIGFGIWVGLWTLVIVFGLRFLSLYRDISKKVEQILAPYRSTLQKPKPPSNLPAFSWADIATRVQLGQEWMVIDGKVYDTATFSFHHPGGRGILVPLFGRDATMAFHAIRNPRVSQLSGDTLHKHTRYANWLLSTMCVGTLQGPANKIDPLQPHTSPHLLTQVASPETEMQALDPPVMMRKRGNSLESTGTGLGDAFEMLSTEKYTSLDVIGCVVLTSGEASARVILLRLALPAVHLRLDLQPDEFLTLKTNSRGVITMRSYTPVTPVHAKGYIDLIIKIYKTGALTPILAKLQQGDKIDVKLGMSPEVTPLVDLLPNFKFLGLIAGGTGVTSVLKLLRSFRKGNPNGIVRLLYVVQVEADLLCRAELVEIAKASNGLVQLHFCVTRATAAAARKLNRLHHHVDDGSDSNASADDAGKGGKSPRAEKLALARTSPTTVAPRLPKTTDSPSPKSKALAQPPDSPHSTEDSDSDTTDSHSRQRRESHEMESSDPSTPDQVLAGQRDLLPGHEGYLAIDDGFHSSSITWSAGHPKTPLLTEFLLKPVTALCVRSNSHVIPDTARIFICGPLGLTQSIRRRLVRLHFPLGGIVVPGY